MHPGRGRRSNSYSRDCAPRPVDLKRVLQAWSGATTTVYPGPSLGETIGSASFAHGGSGCADANVSIPITAAVRNWVSGAWPNHGLAITANEADPLAFKHFHTAQAASGQPYVSVKYTDSHLGKFPTNKLVSERLSDRMQLHVNPYNGNAVVEATDVNLPGVNGLDVRLDRFFNSRADHAGIPGAGWTFSMGNDIRLIRASDNSGDLLFKAPSGYWKWFARSGSGWTRPKGLKAKVTQNGTGYDYTVEFTDSGLKYRFVGEALSSIADSDANKITFAYTGGKVTGITDTHGETTAVAYGANGHVETVTDPDGRVVRYGYDGDRLTSVTDATAKTAGFAYDADGNLTEVVDPRGKRTRLTYDGADRVETVTWADSTTAAPAVTRYRYPVAGTTEVVDQRGGTTKYVFDGDGRVKEVYDQNGLKQSMAYDPTGNVVAYTNDQGGIGRATYSPDGLNVTTATLPTGAKDTFEYTDVDAPQRPSKYTNPQGVVLQYDWDANKRLESITDGLGKKTDPAYNPDGTVDKVTDPNGNVTDYTYDTRRRLTRVDHPVGLGDVNITYDDFDRTATVRDGKGQTTSYTYDALDRIKSTGYANPDGAAAGKITYTYDQNGNQTGRADSVAGASTYTYDARNRVLNETLPNTTNTYGYDPAGNLASVTDAGGTTSYTYDPANRVASVTPPGGQAIRWTYDRDVFVKVAFPNKTFHATHLDNSGRAERVENWR